PIAHLLPERIGEARAPAGEIAGAAADRIRDADFDELLGVFHRQRADAYRVEQLKDRGVGADAERERQNGHDGETRIETQQPRAVLEIAPRAVDELDGVHLIDLLTDQRGVAQLAARRIARVGRAHAARDVLVG